MEMTPEHLDRLRQIARNGENRDSIAAIKLMWSYAYGNPAQVVTGEDGGPVHVSIGDLFNKLKQIEESSRGGEPR